MRTDEGFKAGEYLLVELSVCEPLSDEGEMGDSGTEMAEVRTLESWE